MMALPTSKKARLVRRVMIDVPGHDAIPERPNDLAYAAVVKGY